MRRAIEKLTFLLLSFAAASLVSFALLARLLDHGQGAAALPLLVNLSPHDARDLSLSAMHAAALGGPAGARAGGELARLGGAALPHVLPLLEALEPTARGRVALALAPIARRMGVAADDDLDTPERAIVFFTRFWQDRSADFRAQAVRRKVQRLAERSLPLRRKEVIELDTFALGELFEALGNVHGPEDVKRVERLAPVLAHVTGVPLVLGTDPSVEAAARVATSWRDWAFDHGSDFTTLDGPGRLAAMVMETRYFRFLASVPRAITGDDPSGAERLNEVLTLGRTTVPLVLLSVALAMALSVAVARWLRGRLAGPGWAALLATGLATLPLAALAVHAASIGVVALVVAQGLGLAALLLLELDGSHSGLRDLRRILSRGGALLPLALSAELAAEAAQDRGLGRLTRLAFAAGDLEALMWIAALLSATGCLAILAPDAAPGPHDHAEPSPSELIPARRNRWAVLTFGVVIGLLASAAALRGVMAGSLSTLASAAGRSLLTAVVATAIAAAVAFTLGVLAGGLSRAADTLLARVGELSLALPQPLVAVCALTLGAVIGPALLGVLRGVEVAQLLRLRLAERRVALEIDPPSLGRAPISPYLKRVLPAALAPAATTLALTGAWLATFDAASAKLGTLRTASLGSLAAASGMTAFVALVASALFAGAACWLARELSPREEGPETLDTSVVLALKRRIDTAPPDDPGAGSEPPIEP